ncbi:hypothetical protein IPM19_03905 [bacterium]|nr:MAG: hypothetical protein IPM19_03905 [bacterium]
MKLEGIDLAISQGAILKAWSSSARDVVMRIDTHDGKEIFAEWSTLASTMLEKTNRACSKFFKDVEKLFRASEVWGQPRVLIVMDMPGELYESF